VTLSIVGDRCPNLPLDCWPRRCGLLALHAIAQRFLFSAPLPLCRAERYAPAAEKSYARSKFAIGTSREHNLSAKQAASLASPAVGPSTAGSRR